MALNANLLQASLNLVVRRRPELTERFYEILFERFPQARRLFTRNTIKHQASLLQTALASVVGNVDNPEWLSKNLGDLGKRHLDYGITEEMYDWVGEALIATLAEVAGDDWTPDLQTAWVDAYGAITSLMKAGAQSAQA